MNARLTLLAGAWLASLALSSQTVAAELALPRDGWASWQVAAVDGAPDMCCWHGMKPGAAARSACNLDDERGNLGNRDDAKTNSVRIYAHVVSGQVERLRALSATCAVESRTPIRDLGNVDADDSARWLIAHFRRADQIKTEDSHENILAAIGMHRGAVAHDELVSTARRGERLESRRTAIFWLAKARGLAGASVVTELMFGDPDARVREHTAFAITESQSPRIAQDLIRLGNTDKNGEVRSQAWFWLAQTGAPAAEEAIVAAIGKDEDGNVREEAVFALSQLPGDRATRALIAAAENQTMSREQRKRAVFWLAQSEAQGAQAYLDKVLTRNVSR